MAPRKKVDAAVAGEVAAVWEPIADLIPWLKNPRKITDRDIAKVAASIRRFGFAAPIIVQRSTNEIIAGHTRLQAAPLAGYTLAPVRRMDLSDKEAHALAIADNKANELARWDDVALVDVLKSIDITEALCFSDLELKNLLAGDIPLLTEADDVVPELPKTPASKVGDVYLLGGHRLACGDFRTKTFWDGVEADMVWTDPPYGVSYEAKNADLKRAGKSNRKAGTVAIENDTMSADQLRAFLREAFGVLLARSKPGAAWYVAAPPGPIFCVFGNLLIELAVWHHTLNWIKDSFVLGRCDYHYRHESIFYGWKPGAAHYWAGARNLDTSLSFPRPKQSNEHPTMKPPALVQHCIENSSRRGELVADAFMGSGTTIVAAERTERRAIGTEISPQYCDVAVERWKQLTGGAPELLPGSPSIKGKRRSTLPAAE